MLGDSIPYKYSFVESFSVKELKQYARMVSFINIVKNEYNN